MKVLFLGPEESPLIRYLNSVGEDVVSTIAPIDITFIDKLQPEFVVSHGYRHIIKQDVLDRLIGRVINLHISYLPWNRGADPNFWSFVDDTPKGVTIHCVDQGVDTGDILAQREVAFSGSETLRTSYEILQREILSLFQERWTDIRSGRCARTNQIGPGSFHRVKDKEALSYLLVDGWDTEVSLLQDYAAETQASLQFQEQCDVEIKQLKTGK